MYRTLSSAGVRSSESPTRRYGSTYARPDSVKVRGLVLALLVTVTVPVGAAPVTVGWKVRLSWQVPPLGMGARHVPRVAENGVPAGVTATLLMTNGSMPV